MKKGFTLLELLVVIAIIGIIASIVMASVRVATNRAYQVRLKEEIRAMMLAIELWVSGESELPCDVNRSIPPGLEEYLAGDDWPKGPWPGTVYDYEYWHHNHTTTGPNPDPTKTYCAGGLSDGPAGPVYQISLRCDIDNTPCIWPNESWVKNDWDSASSAYYCISGPCRSHGSRPYNHPGCCFGGDCPNDQPSCNF